LLGCLDVVGVGKCVVLLWSVGTGEGLRELGLDVVVDLK